VISLPAPEVFLAQDIRTSPPGRRWWVEPGMLGRDRAGRPWPWFRMDTVCRVFFARSSSWLRLHLRAGDFVLDGEPMEFYRDASKVAARLFTLADVERMAHALHQKGMIDDTQLLCTLQTVIWVARQHGILGE
jgi:hypothetical protein